MSEYRITTADLSSGCREIPAKESIAQWDQGQILKLSGIELPPAYQVEFCNPGDAETVTMIGNADGVEIPDALLETGKTIIAYLVLHDTESDRESEYWVTILVKPRPKPGDVTPDPGEQTVIDQLIAALDAGVEAAETAQRRAEDAQQNSETDALKSEGYAAGTQNGEEVQSGSPYFMNNSKFYSEVAQQGASEAGWVYFYIDNSGYLHYVKTENADLDFYIDSNGNLHVTNGRG